MIGTQLLMPSSNTRDVEFYQCHHSARVKRGQFSSPLPGKLIYSKFHLGEVQPDEQDTNLNKG